MSIIFRDFGTAYLAAPLSAGATSLTVDNPAWLPSLQTGDYFYLVLQKYADRSYVEIVKVTATSGAVCTVVRAQSGTAARSFAVGDYAELRLTTDSLVEFIAQNIATKMDKSGGGDFVGNYRFLNANVPRIDLVRTADNVVSSVLMDFSVTEGHRTILGAGVGANAATPSILLRPNGYDNDAGQLRVDKDGLVDVVACVMRGAQRTEAGAAVRYDYLGNFVPVTRKVNGRELTADVTLTPSDVKAAPEGFGLGETQAFTVADMDSDPLTWNGGKMGWIRAISSSTGKPDDQAGVGLLHRYQSGASSIVHVLFFGHNNKMYTRRWSGTAWSVWKASFDSTNKPAIADVTGLPEQIAELEAPRPISSINWQGSVAFRNLLINGDFRIWQRGVSHDWVGSSAKFAADRWNVNFSAAGNASLTPEASRMLGKASAEISLIGKAAGSQFFMSQRIEDTLAWALRGKKATLSFVAKASAPVTLVATVHKPTNTYNDWAASTQLETVPFNVTTVAQRFTFSTGVLDGDKAAFGLQVMFNAVLGIGTLQMTEVQFEVGDVSTPYEYRPSSYELQLCRRYFNVIRCQFTGALPVPQTPFSFLSPLPVEMYKTLSVAWNETYKVPSTISFSVAGAVSGSLARVLYLNNSAPVGIGADIDGVLYCNAEI